jgi:hypothetical protein
MRGIAEEASGSPGLAGSARGATRAPVVTSFARSSARVEQRGTALARGSAHEVPEGIALPAAPAAIEASAPVVDVPRDRALDVEEGVLLKCHHASQVAKP